ncbi:MAG: toxin-antitoxin system YwqK family antitoxin [Candidatus Omnitrophica bacterium]|nr:toxin-antitoxin system YwqK family antitoxin [Candidatus Omnitrophota bacterium]HOX54837.1 toxin-antitoxin system YwqK family antitoxin [Candidatus Omnitrophota bacterium]
MKKILFILIIAGMGLLLNFASAFPEEVIRKTVDLSMEFYGPSQCDTHYIGYYIEEKEIARLCLDRNFNVIQRTGEIPDGVAAEYYPGGQEKFKENFKNNMRQGEAAEYFEDGKTKQIFNFIDDKLDGMRTTFYPSGKLSAEIMYKEGKQNGLAKRYFPEGNLAQESTYKDGEMNGPLKTYYPNGQLQRQATVKDLRDIGISKIYYENGQLQAEFDNDQKTISKVYYEDGTIHGIINYNENGKVVGREYDRHGNLVNEEVMEQPKPTNE